MSKLQQISEGTGLEARYGGGDYIVRVFDDMDGGYDMNFYRSNTDIPHDSETLTKSELEARMRSFQPDLRRWHKIEVES